MRGGGGITGSGIALDGATRGLSTIVFEMQDCGRYIKSFNEACTRWSTLFKTTEVKMVAEVGKERAMVYENGPHVTTPEWMLLPFAYRRYVRIV